MNTGSGTLPVQRWRSSTTTAGTAWTECRSADRGNSDASTAAAWTRGDTSDKRCASSTAGGQCGHVGVT
jgi:hypothetical protein